MSGTITLDRTAGGTRRRRKVAAVAASAPPKRRDLDAERRESADAAGKAELGKMVADFYELGRAISRRESGAVSAEKWWRGMTLEEMRAERERLRGRLRRLDGKGDLVRLAREEEEKKREEARAEQMAAVLSEMEVRQQSAGDFMSRLSPQLRRELELERSLSRFRKSAAGQEQVMKLARLVIDCRGKSGAAAWPGQVAFSRLCRIFGCRWSGKHQRLSGFGGVQMVLAGEEAGAREFLNALSQSGR